MVLPAAPTHPPTPRFCSPTAAASRLLQWQRHVHIMQGCPSCLSRRLHVRHPLPAPPRRTCATNLPMAWLVANAWPGRRTVRWRLNLAGVEESSS